jgi:hypothetical protein
MASEAYHLTRTHALPSFVERGQKLLWVGASPAEPIRCTLLGGFYRAGSDHRKDGEAVGW